MDPVGPTESRLSANSFSDPGGSPLATPFWRKARFLVLVLFLLLGAAIAGVALSRSKGTRPRKSEPNALDFHGVPAYAIQTPPAVLPEKAGLNDEDMVLGVSLGGKKRAYWIPALSGKPTAHVVNDRVGGVPITVSYCDRMRCAKVVAGEANNPLLMTAFGGYAQGKMYVRVGDAFYHLDSLEPVRPNAPPFPYKDLEIKPMTWKEWRSQHPDTDVYVGVEYQFEPSQ